MSRKQSVPGKHSPESTDVIAKRLPRGNPELDSGTMSFLADGARLDGEMKMPATEAPDKIVIPARMIPFSCRNKEMLTPEDAICFYEHEKEWKEVNRTPQLFVKEFRRQLLVSPDNSVLINDIPPCQLTNITKNRLLSSYYQRQFVYTFCNVRWGGEASYTTEPFGFIPCIIGVPRDSVIAIGSHGCLGDRIRRYHFEAGLEVVLRELMPRVVLVYGGGDSIYRQYERAIRFVKYSDYESARRGGAPWVRE